MTTADQLAAAEKDVQIAAAVSYEAFAAAKSRRDALGEQLRYEQMAAAGADPKFRMVVVGQTYRHRDALKRMGLKWDAGIRGWWGTAEQLYGIVLPSGCLAVRQGVAALASMDHADSAY